MRAPLWRLILLGLVVVGLMCTPYPSFATPRASAVTTTTTDFSMSARASERTVTFELDGRAPAGATEAVLWYDTAAGQSVRRFPVEPGASLHRSVVVQLAHEGLTVATPFGGRLDYWWAILGPDGLLQRRSGSVMLPLTLREIAQPETPSLEQDFRWEEAASAHFRFRFYPGSEAERDIEQIKVDAEAALAQASAVIPPTETISITTYLVPRVFWQGGVAYNGSTLMISYADRTYTGVELPYYLVHEATHALAHGLVQRGNDIGGLVGEGVATYATGGHYGPEPIDAWAAVLLRSDRYVPLCDLRATFGDVQHEIAYLEGASFVGYLVRTYGLETFRAFYANEPPVPEHARDDVAAFCASEATRPVAAIGKTYAELEDGWHAYLTSLTPTENEAALFWGQLRFFDLMRQYQERDDPSARILPPPPSRWRPDIVRAFATPAVTETNTVMEGLFLAADRALDLKQPAVATGILDEIATALDHGTLTGPTGRDYTAIASLLRRYGRAQRLGDTGIYTSVVTEPMPDLRPALWSDYRLVLNSASLHANWGVVYAERIKRGLDGQGDRAGLIIRVVRRPTGWRIAAVYPDPQRPPRTLNPLVPEQNGDVVARTWTQQYQPTDRRGATGYGG